MAPQLKETTTECGPEFFNSLQLVRHYYLQFKTTRYFYIGYVGIIKRVAIEWSSGGAPRIRYTYALIMDPHASWPVKFMTSYERQWHKQSRRNHTINPSSLKLNTISRPRGEKTAEIETTTFSLKPRLLNMR